ncbi:unnamed protein product [Paramecium primaurelia]|uniref:NACHT domain-containing protein n=1 Tax=Paramecium primaurelia TaxID=5886 RepID=A0A8S1Q2A3_PARPR|nr:unnamed protein product [Paramecium primaurelia]
MCNFQIQLKNQSVEEYDGQNIKMKLFQREKIFDISNELYYFPTFLDTSYQLRGGGCAIQKTTNTLQFKAKNAIIPLNFAANLEKFTIMIVEKSNLYQDKIYQDEILIAFQWFFNHKEYFQVLCNDQLLNSINYELIEKSVERLIKQLSVYVKLSGFLFHSLLQIINDLLRVIFSSQLKNEDRYIQFELQQSLLNTISETEEQIKVESSKIWITGVDFELQIIKTCITHLRTNSEIGQELLLSFLCQVANSVTQLSPTSELIDTIIEGGKYLLMNFYDKQIQHPLEKYEIYYFFENLKWSLINQLKQSNSITTTIIHLQKGYCKYIQQSKDWMIHFCWINLLSDIISYRPILSKSEILELQNQKQIDQKQFFPESQFVQVVYDKTLFKIKLLPDDKSNFQNLFEELKLFQEYSLEKQEKIQLLPNYLNFKFDNNNDGSINDEDLNIQILTKESNLEILKPLNNILLQSRDALIQNFNQIDIQLKRLQSIPTIQDIEKQEVKENIALIIKQLKQESQLFIFTLSQIQLLVIREIEIDKVFLQILEKEDNNLSQNVKPLKQQLLQIIKDSEQNFKSQFTPNIKNIVNFWVVHCQLIAIYQSQYLFSENKELESLKQDDGQSISNQFHSTILNLHNFLRYFIGQITKSKKIFKQIYEKTTIKQYFQNALSQKQITEIAIQLYNPNLILQLNNEFQDSYKKFFESKWKLETDQDLKVSFIGCYFIQMNFKIIRRLLLFHKQNLAYLTLQKNHSRFVSKLQSNNFGSNSLNQPIIESLIIEKRQLIQKHFDKYNDKELTDQEANDLSQLQKQVAQSIKEIKFKKWPSQLSTILIIFFQEILTKLQILELNYKNKNTIKEEIFKLIEIQLTKQYEQDLSVKQIQVIDKEEQNEQEMIPQLFNCDIVIQKISLLIAKSTKVQKIIQQKYINFCLSQSIQNHSILQNTWESFKLNINEAFKEIEEMNKNCGLMLSNNDQMVFFQSFIERLSKTQNFDQINANILLFNTQTFLDQINSNLEQEIMNDKKLSFLLSELKTDLISKQGGEIQDLFEDSSYKVRESLAYNLIKIQSIVFETPIQEFCSKLLKDLWIFENHDSVRNILKNEEMVKMQKRLFSQDLTTFSNSLKVEMQTRLKSIEQLETLVLIGDNQTEMKKQLQQAYDDFETYLDNITDMSQRLDISLVFLKEITKDLKNIKISIEQVLQSVKGLEDDIRKLRGKDFMELLQIRKDKILKQMLEKELDQVHIQINTQEYDPVSGSKKKSIKGKISYLLKSQQNDFDGEINEFLWSDKDKIKDVLLLRGKAGSGKSRASSNIEELLWIHDKIQPCWIPIFVSLPSLKDPRHNLIEQALESENYNFDNIQIRDFKEAISNGKLKVLFILESYDEIKTDFIGSNIYQMNRFAQDLNLQVPGQSVKVIVTTREEILISIGYQTWFYGQSIDTLKEVELLPFNREQSQEYIQKYIKISVKRTIKRFYEFLKQLKGQTFILNEFKQIWSNLEDIIDMIIIQKQIDDVLFSSYDAEKLVKKLQSLDFFNFIKTEQMLSLKKELLQLWSEPKFSQVIHNVNIDHLLCTPFMMEIIVYVLPKMSQQFSQATYIRDVVTKNYLILKRQANYSKQLINQLQNNEEIQQQKQEINETKIISQKQNQDQIKADKAILEQFHFIMEELDNQNFFESFSITNQLEYINNSCIGSSKNFYVKFDANFIVSAFKLNQLNAFDFYETFVDYYSNQQIEKQKDLGKVTNSESFYIDLQDLSLYLAIDMSMRQITQVNYKQKGKLQIQNVHEDRNDQKSWDDLYFDQILDNPEYKSQLRKCMLITAKGNLYAFNHKSIQDYFVAKYIQKLYTSIFDQNQVIDIKSLEKSIYNNQLFNLSQEHYFGALELLKPKLMLVDDIKNKLITITKLSKTDSQIKVIRSASNSIYLLSYMGEHLENIDFKHISIQNTKINELTFFACDLSYSIFDNVSIDQCNFNCSIMKNVNWKNLICREKRILDDHNKKVISINFTEDGSSIISVSREGLIKKWLIYSNEDPKSLNLNDEVTKTSYSKINDVLICLTTHNILTINCQQLIQDKMISLPNYQYYDICLQQDMQYLAANVQIRNKIYLWQIKDIQQQKDIQPIISQSKNNISISCLAVTKDFKFIATGDKEIIIWMGDNGKKYQEIVKLFENSDKKTQSLLFSQDEQILISGGEDCKIRFWNIKNNQKIQLLFQLDTLSPIISLSYQVEGRFLTVRTDHEIKLYDAQNPMLTQTFFRQEIDFDYKVFQISPNSKTLAISTTEKQNRSIILIWDISDYSNMKQLSSFINNDNDEDKVIQLQFSSDGQILFSITMNSVYIWNLKLNKLISKLQNQFKNIQNFSLSTDQLMFSICSNDMKLTLWNIQKLEQPQNIATLSLQHEGCYAYFCPNEQLLISFSKKSKPSGIVFWDSKQYKLISTEIQDEIIRDVSFNQEGTIMISFSNSIRIWKKNQSQFQIQARYKYYCDKITQSYIINNQQIIVLKDNMLIELTLSNDNKVDDHLFYYQERVTNFDFANNGKFLIINGSKKNGLLLFLIDQQQQSLQYKNGFNSCNDFSITQDFSIIAIANGEGTDIQYLKTKQLICYLEEKIKCTCVCFYKQKGNNFLIIGSQNDQGQLNLYDTNNIVAIKKIVSISLFCCPHKIQYLEKQQQVIILYNHILTLHNTENLGQTKIILIKSGQNISKNFLLNQEQSTIGLGIDNEICFYSLSNLIDTESIATFDTTNIVYFGFSKYSQTLDIFKESSIFIKWDLTQSKIIQKVDLKIKKLSQIIINEQETQFIAISLNEQQQQKLITIDWKSMKQIQTFEQLTQEKGICQVVVYTSDGTSFVTGYSNRTFKFWDTKSCKPLQMFNSYTSSIDLIQISNRGIMAQTTDNKIKLWNIIALNQQQSQQTGHLDQINRLIVSPDGLSLVSGSQSQIIRWNLKEMKKIDILLEGVNLPSYFSFSSDGQYFAAFEEGNWIKVWKITSLNIIEHCFRLLFSIHTENFQFNNEKNQLISKTKDKQILIWDLENAYLCKKLPNSILKPEESFTIISSDTKLIVTSKPFKIIYPEEQMLFINDKLVIGAIAISHDSKLIGIEDFNKSITIWSVESKKLLHTFNFANSKSSQILAIAFSKNNKKLLSTHMDEIVRLWNVVDGEYSLLQEVQVFQFKQFGSVQIFPVDEDNFLTLWAEHWGYDIFTECLLSYYYWQNPQRKDIDISSNHNYLNFTAGYSEQKKMFAIQFQIWLHLYDINTNQIVAILEGNQLQKQNLSTVVSFSYDGTQLITKGANHILRLWDISDINNIKLKINFKSLIEVKAAHFLMDGETIRIIGKDDTIYHHTIQQFTQICRISKQQQFEFLDTQIKQCKQFKVDIKDLEFSIVDVVKNELKQKVNYVNSKISNFTFTPSGQQFILGLEDGSIHIYCVSKQILDEYQRPVCYKIFARSTQLQADFCQIGMSIFKTKENENLQKLFIEKGAII